MHHADQRAHVLSDKPPETVLNASARLDRSATDHYFSFECKPAKNFDAQLCRAQCAANHKGSSRADVGHIKLNQFFGEKAGTKRFVSTNVDASRKTTRDIR